MRSPSHPMLQVTPQSAHRIFLHMAGTRSMHLIIGDNAIGGTCTQLRMRAGGRV